MRVPPSGVSAGESMRSLFWRVFATFWLAVVVAVALAALLGLLFNRDAWIISRHPALQGLAHDWAEVYELQGAAQAQRFLEQRHHQAHVDVQVLDERGQPLVRGTVPAYMMEPRTGELPEAPRPKGRDGYPPPPPMMPDGRPRRDHEPPWRRLAEEYTRPESGNTYLFLYRLPLPELSEWRRSSLLPPLSGLAVATLVLGLFSYLLTRAITRPLGRLREAVNDLGQTSLQQDSLQQLAVRSDEFGVLARDFSRMGGRLQELIGSQRQLLHDVSHELRSPLARLRLALALAGREGMSDEERQRLWPRITRECDRLEALISEILVLARVDAGSAPADEVELVSLLKRLAEDARVLYPANAVQLEAPAQLYLQGWGDLLERAVDNLLRNALRFSPAGQSVQLEVQEHGDWLCIQVRDSGLGVSAEYLARLGEPFFRAPGQELPGHGLGLAIARRAAQRHDGQLLLANRPEGGFVATLQLPRSRILRVG